MGLQSISRYILESLRIVRLIAGHHGRILMKKLRAGSLPSYAEAVPDPAPAVTVLVTNMNNRAPLELTLRTLFAQTQYPNFEVWVADNDSTDGSIEMVETLQGNYPIRLIRGPARPQHEWYDYLLEHAPTPFWVGIHEDLIFLGSDWLADLVGFMEAEPQTHMLGGEYFPAQEGVGEPVGGEIVDLRESLSTWIFCVRSSLREHVNTSFAFHKYWDENKLRTVAYDQGGKLIEDMRATGLRFACMPPWYLGKWCHLANISWVFLHDASRSRLAFKRYQIWDADRRARAARRRLPQRQQRPQQRGVVA